MRIAAFWTLAVVSLVFLFSDIRNTMADNEPIRLDGPDALHRLFDPGETGIFASSDGSVTDGPGTELVIHHTDFISQAPLGNWFDPRQQDGCEEAAALMAMNWSIGPVHLTPEQSEEEIRRLSDWQSATYGTFQDTSAQDTADRILSRHYNFNDFETRHDITAEDIKSALYAGNVVLATVDGTKLGNPHFRSGGPARHMVLVLGYDPTTQEFITHDPGTSHGAYWRYGEETLQTALRDYSSGNHLPVTATGKAMVIVHPQFPID